MGVKACNRTGCPRIMCDRYSSTFGYICNTCFHSIVRLGLGIDIKAFMNTPINKVIGEDTAQEVYDRIFALPED